MKKLLSLILALAMMLSLAACGSSEEPASSAPVVSEGATSTTEAEPVTIEFFQMKNEGTEYYEAVIDAFETEYPHITVEHTNVPDAETVLMTRLSSGQVPDVFTHWSFAPSFKGIVDAGFAMDLTGMAGLENVDDVILEETLIDGKPYSVPVSLNMLGVYYNTELFEQVGITAVPSTMDELYAICETFVEAGITPFICPDKDVWTVSQFVDRGSVAMLADPAQLYRDIAAGEVVATESDELRAMGEAIVKLRSYAQPDSLGTGYEQAIAEFATGNAAMFFSGTFAYPEIVKSNADVPMEMFQLPSIGGENLDRVGINVDTAFAVSAETEQPEAAKLFVEFCTNPENAQKFSDYDGSPSAIKGVAYNNDVFANMYESYILTGKTTNIPANSWPAGFGGEHGNLAQELISTGDVDAWLENLGTLIMDTYNQ